MEDKLPEPPADLADLGYVSEPKAGLILDVTPQTMADWRKDDNGPPYTMVGRRFFYHLGKLKDWLDAGGTRASDETPAPPAFKRKPVKRRPVVGAR